MGPPGHHQHQRISGHHHHNSASSQHQQQLTATTVPQPGNSYMNSIGTTINSGANNSSNQSSTLANMLRPKTLNNILAKANTGGVKCTLLLNREGSLLAYAGGTDEEAITTAALASTIWKNFEKYGNSAFHEDKLKCAVIQCQEANLVVRNLSTVLLCIYANQDVPLGMLKNKAKCLADYIEEPLDKILRT